MSFTWDITLKPEINVASTDIGKGRAVRLKTVDERASPVIGKHHDTKAFLNFGGYAIYTSKGAREVVETALLDGFKRKGFKPSLEEGSAEYGLRVDIQRLDYSYTQFAGFFTNTLRTAADLKGTCIVNGKDSYDRVYWVEETDSGFMTAPISIRKDLENVLSKAIQSLLDDPKLQECLAQ